MDQNLLSVHHVHQLALFPGLEPAVDVAVPGLVTVVVYHPPGVAHLPGDILAAGNLLGLIEVDLFIPITFLGREVLLSCPVTSEGLLPGDFGTVSSSFEGAGGLGNIHTDPLRSWNTFCPDGVGADLVIAGIVVNRCVS